ncbi:universal stress protein UspA-like protein [filamentous cyanobacterium CCP2]|nr:universal stress protein UspA-like protein [filamentous cyanobacterium CCP2]
MFQRLLICTDFVDGLNRLVNFVPSLAESGIKQIVFLHIVPLSGDKAVPRADEDAIKTARDRLSVATQNVPDGVDVHVEVQAGQHVERILSTASTYKCDIILVGTQSRSLLTEKLFGSTAVALCNQAKIPLMVFRPQLLSTYMVGELDLRCRNLFRYFLIPYDGSKVADFLVEQIKQRVKNSSSGALKQCLLCWVVEGGGRRDLSALVSAEASKTAKTKLEALQADMASLGLEANYQVLHGDRVLEILMAAQEYDISAITLSSDSVGKLVELSVPSFAGELIRRSWHPIIYFPK